MLYCFYVTHVIVYYYRFWPITFPDDFTPEAHVSMDKFLTALASAV